MNYLHCLVGLTVFRLIVLLRDQLCAQRLCVIQVDIQYWYCLFCWKIALSTHLSHAQLSCSDDMYPVWKVESEMILIQTQSSTLQHFQLCPCERECVNVKDGTWTCVWTCWLTTGHRCHIKANCLTLAFSVGSSSGSMFNVASVSNLPPVSLSFMLYGTVDFSWRTLRQRLRVVIQSTTFFSLLVSSRGLDGTWHAAVLLPTRDKRQQAD